MSQKEEGICGFKDPKKFQFGNEGFPVFFDDGRLRVYKNPTNEIFVEDCKTGATMRINSGRNGLQFTTSEVVEPVQVPGMIGWRVGPR